MGDVVNLNKFRKTLTRTQKENIAQKNRVIFGRTKSQKETAKAETKRQSDLLSSKKITENKNTYTVPDENT